MLEKSTALAADERNIVPFEAVLARAGDARAHAALTESRESGSADPHGPHDGITLPPHFPGPRTRKRAKRNRSRNDVAFGAVLPPLVLWKINRVKTRRMHWATRRALIRRLKRKAALGAVALAGGVVLSAITFHAVSVGNSFDRIQAGQWVIASMYWQDKLVSTGKAFQPTGLHAAHKTLPIGTLIRVSNPKNHRSINITINDRGPFIEGRELDLTLGAGALLGFSGLGPVFMEVIALPGDKKIDRPLVEHLFTATAPASRSPAMAAVASTELEARARPKR